MRHQTEKQIRFRNDEHSSTSTRSSATLFLTSKWRENRRKVIDRGKGLLHVSDISLPTDITRHLDGQWIDEDRFPENIAARQRRKRDGVAYGTEHAEDEWIWKLICTSRIAEKRTDPTVIYLSLSLTLSPASSTDVFLRELLRTGSFRTCSCLSKAEKRSMQQRSYRFVRC